MWIGVTLLGGAGAVARVGGGAAIARRLGSVWAGTLAINLIGTFGLGFIAGLSWTGDGRKLLTIGFLAAFTTFSTWMVEAERDRSRPRGVALLVGALLLGLGAVWLGRQLGEMI
jgi:CrcB protein